MELRRGKVCVVVEGTFATEHEEYGHVLSWSEMKHNDAGR